MRSLIGTEKIVELYNEGKSAVKIAKELGCARTTVYNRLSQAGVKKRSLAEAANYRRDYSKSLKGMIQMYQEGYSMVDVGAEYNCSGPSVKRQLLLAGVKLRGPGEFDRRPSGTLRRVKREAKTKKCICCGSPVPRKPIDGVYLTRLCVLCWKNKSDRENCAVHLKGFR